MDVSRRGFILGAAALGVAGCTTRHPASSATPTSNTLMGQPGNLQRAYDEVSARYGTKLTEIDADPWSASFSYADRRVSWLGPGKLQEAAEKSSSDRLIDTEGLSFPDFEELIRRARVALGDPSADGARPRLTITADTDWKRARRAELRLDAGTAHLDSTLQPFPEVAVDELAGLRSTLDELKTLSGTERGSLLSLDAHADERGVIRPVVGLYADNRAAVTGTVAPPVMVLERARRARRGGPNEALGAIRPTESFDFAALNLELLFQARDMAVPDAKLVGWSGDVRRRAVVGGASDAIIYSAFGPRPAQPVFLDDSGRMVNVAA